MDEDKEGKRPIRVEYDAERKPSFVLRLAVEHSPKERTRKGYDTTGIIKQFLVNALNEVLHLDGWRVDAVYHEPKQGWGENPACSSLCELTLFLRFCDADPASAVIHEVFRDAWGGHSDYHGNEGDSRKGAHTAAFKRACAEFGLGREAFEGLLDPDFMELQPSQVKGGRARQLERTTMTVEAPAPEKRRTRKKAEEPAGMSDSTKKAYAWLAEKIPSITEVPDWKAKVSDYANVTSDGVEINTAAEGDGLRKVLSDVCRSLNALRKKPEAVVSLLETAREQRDEKAETP